ncbi:hypothetical protein TNCV_3819941 [Trichonephila clavipes]|uniref:Uncharacterized protein n=1 Tax=Trichonephila clavipes TaxID=2585209 RepID=A0A8X6R872_TRICX|nr:hypothetical protein TNCV_3819941 [Trichonephila clavipes]
MSQFTLGNSPPSRLSSLDPNPPYFVDYITPIADRDSDLSRISPVRIPQSSPSPLFLSRKGPHKGSLKNSVCLREEHHNGSL